MTKLTLGPLLYGWPADKRRGFFAQIADDAPVDTVHLGEVVCAKRLPFIDPLLPDLFERLERGGKEVVLSTLALVMSEEDREIGRAMCDAESDGWLVEANDLSAVHQLTGRDFAVGPLINTYDEGTVQYLATLGATRICLPPELSLSTITKIAGTQLAEIELQIFGRLQLAISARCPHARSYKLRKDGCQFICGEDLDGLDVDTLDRQDFLAVNGLQTQSHAYAEYSDEVEALLSAGVERYRLSPQDCDMISVANAYRALLESKIDPAECQAQLKLAAPNPTFSNGFLHGVAGVEHAAAS